MIVVLKTDDNGVATSVFGSAVSGGWASLPDGSMISPAIAGIEGKGYRLEELGEPPSPPNGFRGAGDRRISLSNGSPVWVESFVEVEKHFPELTHRQFWLAAWDVGITKQSVKEKVLSSYPEEERDRVAMEVELTTTFSRNHPLVDELCVMSGLSPAELDALWVWAASI